MLNQEDVLGSRIWMVLVLRRMRRGTATVEAVWSAANELILFGYHYDDFRLPPGHEQKQFSILRRIKSQDIDNQNISLHPLFAAPPKSYDQLEGLVIFLCVSAPRIGLLSTPANSPYP